MIRLIPILLLLACSKPEIPERLQKIDINNIEANYFTENSPFFFYIKDHEGNTILTQYATCCPVQIRIPMAQFNEDGTGQFYIHAWDLGMYDTTYIEPFTWYYTSIDELSDVLTIEQNEVHNYFVPEPQEYVNTVMIYNYDKIIYLNNI